VTATYRVDEEDRPAFLDVLNSLSEERRKDGAYAWGISEDAADPSRLSSGSSSSHGRNTCANTTEFRRLMQSFNESCSPPHGT
jgi:hypothetical protein